MYVFLIFLDYFVVLFVIVRSMFCARYCLCLWIVNLWLSLRVSLPFIYYLQLFFNIMVWVHYILFDDRIYFWFNTPLSTCHFNVISASAVVTTKLYELLFLINEFKIANPTLILQKKYTAIYSWAFLSTIVFSN
jgi:hypothetical protein